MREGYGEGNDVDIGREKKTSTSFNGVAMYQSVPCLDYNQLITDVSARLWGNQS